MTNAKESGPLTPALSPSEWGEGESSPASWHGRFLGRECPVCSSVVISHWPPHLRRKADYLRLHEALEISECQFDHLGMGAGIEGDLIIFGQGFRDINVHAVKIAKGRHRPNLAIGKELLKVFFRSEFDFI